MRSSISFDPSTGLPALVKTVGRLLYARIRAHDPKGLFMAHAMDPDRRRLTYGELLHDALGLAHGLVEKMGLGRGDRVVVVAPNHERFHMVEFACMFAGIVVVPTVPQLTVHEGVRLMGEAKPHVVVVHSTCYQVINEALKQAKLSSRMLLLDDAAHISFAPTSVQLMRDMIVPGQVALPAIEAQASGDDTAIMFFTSGTTGLNKAVQVTHRMILTTMAQMQAHAAAAVSGGTTKGTPAFGAHDVTTVMRSDGITGFFHLSGTFTGLSSAIRGGIVYFFERFDVGDWLDAVSRLKITQSVITPQNLVALAKDERAKSANLASLELITSIGAPLSPATQQRAMDVLKVPIVQGYASTETLGIAMPQWGKSSSGRPGTIGWLLPGIDALLLDPETNEPLCINKNGETGPAEIALRGPAVMSPTSGYFGRPLESMAAFITFNNQLYFRTGDLVVVDTEGCLSVVDRSKGVFGVSGSRVIPSEIEAEILKNHNVLDVVVVPIPIADEQQQPCAAVVPRSKSVLADPIAQKALAKAISNLVAQNLTHHKHLKGGIVFMDAIPRNPTGKIKRAAARAKVLETLGLMGKAKVAI
ncbi:4-coumarate--CoA ligase-like 5 [Allomyces javanicus]|nr:4-coumarate--CoA ligase-like 5 [Allomyces javanicus]